MQLRRESIARSLSASRALPTPIPARRYCVVNHNVTLGDYAKQRCSAGMHIHCTAAEIADLLQLKAVEYLTEHGDARHGYLYRFKKTFAVRGLSARFGEELARMMARDDGRNFAAFMLSEIRRRRASDVRDEERDPLG